MKQIGDSNEDMLALLEAVVDIKNELLYIREYFPHLLQGEIYLTDKQACEMLHISKRTLQKYRDDGLIPFIKLSGKILFRESDIRKILEDNYQCEPLKKNSLKLYPYRSIKETVHCLKTVGCIVFSQDPICLLSKYLLSVCITNFIC